MDPHSVCVNLLEMFESPTLLVAFLLFVAWNLIWKGWALWLAARRGEKGWFIALLLFNTAGLLEMFYIFFVAHRRDTSKR